MLLSINERTTQDLLFLAGLPTVAHVVEFCRAALDALVSGAKRATFKHAASALGADVEAVSGSIMAIAHLFVEAAKRDLSHSELLSSLGDVAVPDEYKRAVTAFYSECAGSLREGLRLAPAAAVNRASDGADAPAVTAPVAALSLAVDAAPLPFLPVSGASADIPQLRGLDWRLDVDIARRHVHEVLEPNYLLRLNVYGLGPPAAADAGARAGVDARALSALGPHAITFSADFATLKSAAMAMDEAVAELRTPHAKRVVRYIR